MDNFSFFFLLLSDINHNRVARLVKELKTILTKGIFLLSNLIYILKITASIYF